ncbi:Bacteriophage (PhiC31) resistance protein PglY [Euzebya pacifica]|uniref:Bacteriophage (PhiC31) resistance protein PglY n=1 Tax=Euzebya pacifica TaxID=1608957 RepID=A0A346XRY0_9ACTN|nr:Bacteriophage (PhiC31) resistance protein PglY [Euzebya pacifica]
MLQDLIHIPHEVHKSDFVMALKDGVTQADATLDAYVVTPQLAECFDEALSLITSAVSEGSSKGTYLHGSFGSGKSHFMAVLHLLLQGNDSARSRPELAPVITKHDARLDGLKFLQIPYRLIGAESLEQAVLGGYVDHVTTLHPEAKLPAVFAGDQILADAKEMRGRLGDKAFFEALGGSGEDDDGFGDFAAGWSPDDFDRAVADGPSTTEGRRLIADLVATIFTAYRRQGDMVDLDTGLSAISQHAKQLGYDGLVLFLDELILWLATKLAIPGFVQFEASKLATLVESSKADRPAPIISFIARQRDLTDFTGVGLTGASQTSLSEQLKHISGRFSVIELADKNLPEIVSKRLLKPKGEAEAQQLEESFNRVWEQAKASRDTLITSHGDQDDFRRVYPFSPALVETLVAVSGYLQRERTALRLLLQLLVDKRETLQVGDLVPLGDLWDQVSGEDSFSPQLKVHFDRARALYRRLRTNLLEEHGVDEEHVKGLPDTHAFRRDDRLVKTLLLSALVPEVEPLRNLTVSRLAALNHGTIATPIPGQERTVVLGQLTKWAAEVPEIRIEDGQDPQVSLKLTGVDTTAILDQARNVDSTGARRAKIKELLASGFAITLDSSLLPTRYQWVWRGSKREVEIKFGNIRDRGDLPDGELHARDVPRLVVDFPFDEHGFTPADDRARVQELQQEGTRSATVCWLPLFLTEKAGQLLGDLVVVDHVLNGDRFESYTTNLSPQDRSEARTLLRNQADTLRTRMRIILQQAYGLTTPDADLVQTDLSPGEQFPTLDPTLTVRPPTSGNLTAALPEVLDQLMAHQHPKHPEFDNEVRIGDLKTCLSLIEKAVSQPNMRLDNIGSSDRKSMRTVLGPLKVATTGEAHLVMDQHWREHFHRKQAEEAGPVTVGRLREWIDQPDSWGLDTRVQNLVICAFALMDDRVMVHGDQPVQPAVDRLDDAVELRTQVLPSKEEWDAARPKAAAIFGATAAPLLSAAGVANLVAQVRAEAAPHRDAATQLLSQLHHHAEALGITTGSDRLRTAKAVTDLLTALAGGEDHTAIAVLAACDVPTSAEAMGTSLKSAERVSARLERMNTGLIASATSLGGDHATAARSIAETLSAKASRDELATSLATAIDDAERAATDLLGRAAQGAVPPGSTAPVVEPQPKPVIEAPQIDVGGERLPRHGSREVVGAADSRALLQHLLAEADDLIELQVRWKKADGE